MIYNLPYYKEFRLSIKFLSKFIKHTQTVTSKLNKNENS